MPVSRVLLHTSSFSLGCLILSASSIFTVNAFAGDKLPTDAFNAPAFFRVFSQAGNEQFRATCRQKNERIVTCDFIGVRIDPPANEGKTKKLLQELNGADSEKKRELMREMDQERIKWLKDPDRDYLVRAIQEQIANPETPPKTKAFLGDTLSALRKGDFLGVLRAQAEKEARTCSLFPQEFSLTFTQIGPRKWLHNTGPAGSCDLVKVYELEKEEGSDLLWTMRETRVSVGQTDSICKDLTDDVGKVTIWSWKHDDGYELPCDFVKF